MKHTFLESAFPLLDSTGFPLDATFWLVSILKLYSEMFLYYLVVGMLIMCTS